MLFRSRLDRDDELVSIPGTPPNLYNEPTGCSFAPRCEYAFDRCTQEIPPLITVDEEHEVACFFDIQKGEAR